MHTHLIWTIAPLSWHRGKVPARRTSEAWARTPQRDPSGAESPLTHHSYQLSRAASAPQWHAHSRPDTTRFGHYHHQRKTGAGCERCLRAEYWTIAFGGK